MKTGFRRLLVFCFAASWCALALSPGAFGSPGDRPADRPGDDPLVGLWGTELSLGPLVRGELVIQQLASGWQARIAGYAVPVASDGDHLKFTLPGDAGEFRGRTAGGRIDGFWIQPSGMVFNNRYANPVALDPAGKQIWRGAVAPLEQRVSVYISIQRAADGSWTAFVRNPEFNFLGRRDPQVQVQGTKIALSQGNQKIEANYDSHEDKLIVSLFPGAAPPVAFTRRVDHNAIGFYPRVLPPASYEYQQPEATGDGWSTATLTESGFQSDLLKQLVEKILTADPRENPLPIQSLLLARHGKLVLEEYFYGFDAERPHDTRSAGKTFAPMLVGLARGNGANLGPDTPVYPLFERYKPFANWDERKNKMQLKDLMSMTAGYDCDEDHGDFPANEDAMQNQDAQPDWYKFMLDAPMAHDPGGDRAYYCSGQLNLVAGAAGAASGLWLPELFDRYYARPLQFHAYALNLMPTGEAYFGGGAYIRARDQLKLGQLYLNRGTWNGKRVLDGEWVRQSLARHAAFEDRFGADHLYGWGWHVHHVKAGDRTFIEYESGGNGGQLVLVFPELDMVVGITGGAYGRFMNWGRWGLELVPQYIIGAVQK
jgi:CubicO group peptidase (beta-lactamase class C family)